MKERSPLSEKDTEGWFNNKVLKKGVRQIRDSLGYLNQYAEISVTNEQGHTFSIERSKIKKITKIVLFLPYAKDTTFFKKCHISQTAKFIHVIDARDYLKICKILLLPADIIEYFEYRERVLEDLSEASMTLSEDMIVGQFISSNHKVEPNAQSLAYLEALKQDSENWDVSNIIANLNKNIERAANPFDYYKILFELVKLPRSACREFKTRFDRAVAIVKSKGFALPFRFVYPGTGCGFIFFATPPEISGSADFQRNRGNIVSNITLVHKYDQKLEKCVGVAIAKDGEDYLIDWCFTEFPWHNDAEMDEKLKDAPIRPLSEINQRRYKFD